jgi:type I site-specific restriction-modification system R (restriction) subunit
MTTIQKFQDHVDDGGDLLLNGKDNIFVFVDESHRTNYGGLAMNMWLSLPNTVYIGFTGTPIDKEDWSTVQTLGTHIDTYTIHQVVENRVTGSIYYDLPDYGPRERRWTRLLAASFRTSKRTGNGSRRNTRQRRSLLGRRSASAGSVLTSPNITRNISHQIATKRKCRD